MKVSVLLLTFNEEATLPVCMQAISWCDDIVVVDSGSKDRTVDIARGLGARVLTRPFDNFAAQRNYGLDQGDLRHDWVLHLDADEVVPAEFVAALTTLAPESHLDGYNVPSKLILFGAWIRHAGMYPTYQVRLGHRDRLRFVQVGHGQREAVPPERVGIFAEPYLHFSFAHGMRRWLEKHVGYAEDEASHSAPTGANWSGWSGGKVQRRRILKTLFSRLPAALRPVVRFLQIYFLSRGFLDGRAGLAYALMMAVYEGMIAVYRYEQALDGSAFHMSDHDG